MKMVQALPCAWGMVGEWALWGEGKLPSPYSLSYLDLHTHQKDPFPISRIRANLQALHKKKMAAVQDLMPVLPGRPFSALGMLQAESQVTLAHHSCQEGFGDMSVHHYFHYYF
jgi:hypothetical protein